MTDAPRTSAAPPTSTDAVLRRPRTWLTAALAVAVLASALDVWSTPRLAPLGLAVAALGALPLAIVLAGEARWRERAGVAWAVAGFVLAVVGTVAAAPDRFLELRLALGSPLLLAQSPLALAGPVLVVTGLALLLGGLGVLASARGAVVAVGLVGSLLAAVLGTTILGGNGLARHVLRGGTLTWADLTSGWGAPAAVLLGVVAVSLLVLAVRARSVVGWPPPAPTPASRRRRLVAATAFAVAGAAVVGLAVELVWQARAGTVVAEEFTDPELAACVARAVGTAVDEEVPRGRLTGLTALECATDPGVPGTGRITDLSGAELLTGLVHVDLTGHAVTDLTPLSGAEDLWSLRLTGNDVRDLSPLSGLEALTDLGLSGTAVDDVTPLAGSSVAYLGLAGTDVADVAPLADAASLHELDLTGTLVRDVTPLARLEHLGRLELAATPVADPSRLAAVPALTVLDVSCSRIADAELLVGLDAVRELWAGGTSMTDVAPLAQMDELVGVDLSGGAQRPDGIAELEAAGIAVGGMASGRECPAPNPAAGGAPS